MPRDHYADSPELHLERISLRKGKVPTVVFFGRSSSFSDNSKYLYLNAVESPCGFAPLWASADPRLIDLLVANDLPVLPLREPFDSALQVLVKAAAAVFCVNPNESLVSPLVRAALAGAFKLQLWHGLFANNLDLQLTDQGALSDPRLTYQLYGAAEVDAVLSPSARHDLNFAGAFGSPYLIRAGYPRNEVLFREPTALEQLGALPDAWLAGQARGPRILFCPTFSKVGRPVWLEPWLVQRLRELHAVLGVTTFIKPHPFEAKAAGAFLPLEPGICILPALADIYPSLGTFDLMISDYSSLMDDFHLTGKPILILHSQEREGLRDGYLFQDLHQERLAGVVTPSELLEATRRALAGDFAGKGSESDYTTPQPGSCSRINAFLASVVEERCAAGPEIVDLGP